LPRNNGRKSREQLGHEREQVANAVAFGPEHRNSKRTPAQVLLKLQVLVHRYQEIEPAPHSVKQFAAGKGGPSKLDNARHLMSGQCRPEPPWNAIVEQYPHT